MHPLLTLNYWFSLTPTPFMQLVEWALLGGFSLFFVSGIAVWIYQMRGKQGKFVKRALGRAASLLAWTGLVGLFLWVAEYEQVPLLSMRFLYVVWVGWVLVWAWFIFQYVRVEIPAIEARGKEREEREKWLPKRK